MIDVSEIRVSPSLPPGLYRNSLLWCSNGASFSADALSAIDVFYDFTHPRTCRSRVTCSAQYRYQYRYMTRSGIFLPHSGTESSSKRNESYIVFGSFIPEYVFKDMANFFLLIRRIILRTIPRTQPLGYGSIYTNPF